MKNSLLLLVAVVPLTLTLNLSSAAAPQKSAAQSRGLQFVDRDCKDFSNQKQAQNFYELAGGPSRDPHRLDQDRDGIACEMLP